jgi:flagellar hook-basal body complex protein FliE
VKIELLSPDVSPMPVSSTPAQSSAFAGILDDVGSVLQRADGAESRYASGIGRLSDAVYERARADVALSVATAAAQRLSQALNSVLNMQI